MWITSSLPCVTGTCSRLKGVRKVASVLSRQKGQVRNNGSGCGQPHGCAGSLNRFVPDDGCGRPGGLTGVRDAAVDLRKKVKRAAWFPCLLSLEVLFLELVVVVELGLRCGEHHFPVTRQRLAVARRMWGRALLRCRAKRDKFRPMVELVDNPSVVRNRSTGLSLGNWF